MNKEIVLLPCPFCGGDVKQWWRPLIIGEGKLHWIECETCKVKLTGNSSDEVVTNWNNRINHETRIR